MVRTEGLPLPGQRLPHRLLRLFVATPIGEEQAKNAVGFGSVQDAGPLELSESLA